MKKLNVIVTTIILLGLMNCSQKRIEDDRLGFINADVTNENTNFKSKSAYGDNQPGKSTMMNRSFENAPPLIPHSTAGFLPIKRKNNACLSCHLPENAVKVNAKPLSKTHFTSVRPKLILVNGVYQFPKSEGVKVQKLKKLNNSYFNCSQCHAPQTKVTIDIKNLFTPEFRRKHGIKQSNLIDKVKEGVK